MFAALLTLLAQFLRSPGFGISLVAETTDGTFLSAETMSNPVGEEITVPEDLGKKAAKLLMEEIYRVCSLVQIGALSKYCHGNLPLPSFS